MMKKMLKHGWIFCLLLAVAMIIGMVPRGTKTAYAENTQIQALLNPNNPTWYEETDDNNPFGYGKDVPFRLYEDAELYTYVSYPSYDVERADIYELYKKSDGSALFEDSSWDKKTQLNVTGESTYSGSEINKHWFVNAVPFDPGYNDAPRNNCIAFIGAKKNGNVFDIDIWVYDTHSKKYSNVLKIGEMSGIGQHIYEPDPEETMFYQMRNFMAITAGDYDNDKKDSIVAYAHFSGGPALTEIQITDNGSAAPTIASGGSATQMLHAKYLDNLATFNTDTSKNGHKKLGCSLATGDINGDKVDDLAVASYAQVIGSDYVPSLGDEIAMPMLAVKQGGAGKTGETLLGAADYSTYVGGEYRDYSASQQPTMQLVERPTVSTPTVVIAKTGFAKNDAVLLGGYGESVLRFKDNNDFDAVSVNLSKAGVFAYALEEDDQHQVSLKRKVADIDTVEIPDALKSNPAKQSEHAIHNVTLPKLPVAAVSLDGTAADDRIFVGGGFYDVNPGEIKSVYALPCLNQTLTSGDFGYGDETLIGVYMDSVSVQSLTKVGGNYESVVFSLVGITKHYEGAGSPYSYHYRFGAAGPAVDAGTSRVVGHYSTRPDILKSQMMKDPLSGDPILNAAQFDMANDDQAKVNCVICPVDYNDDGMTVRYNSKDLLYADPKILAVLQCPPYFKDLVDEGGTTTYKFIREFSYSDEKSDTKSYGVGIQADLETPAAAASLRVGYAGETRKWSSTELDTEEEVSWDASHDSVIVYRTPIIYYTYDVWEPDSQTWEEQGLSITYTRPAEYEQLSVDAYNQFADEYNAEGRRRAQEKGEDPDKFTTLNHLEDGIFLGCEGDPAKYYQGGDAPADYNTIATDGHALSYNGGTDRVSLVKGSSVTHGEEDSDGVSVEFELTFGPEVFRAGVYGSFEELWGHAISDTQTDKTGVETAVNNLNGPALIAQGYTEEQVKAHKFTWIPSRWSSGLQYEYKDENGETKLVRKVPVYGYTLSNVQGPTDLSKATVTVTPDKKVYTGTALTPDTITVTLDGQTVDPSYYDVSYMLGNSTVEQCVDPAVYKVVITGKDSYTGQAFAPFKIYKENAPSIETATMTAEPTEFMYDGTAKAPTVTLTIADETAQGGTKTLIEGTDYQLVYAQPGGFLDACIYPGTYTVAAEGIGEYQGSNVANFTITEPNEIRTADVSVTPTQFNYNGEVQKPTVSVAYGGTPLTVNDDYTVEWSNADSTEPGTYSVTVSGAGNYTGTVKTFYTIIKKDIPAGSITVGITKDGEAATGLADKISLKRGGSSVASTFVEDQETPGLYTFSPRSLLPQGNYTIAIDGYDLPAEKAAFAYNQESVGLSYDFFTVEMKKDDHIATAGMVFAYGQPKDKVVTLLQTPLHIQSAAAAGYHFDGYTVAGSAPTWGAGKDTAEQNIIVTGTAEITAHAENNVYHVTFAPNGGEGEMDVQDMVYDQPQDLFENRFTKTDYKFVGWNTKADGSGTTYTDKQRVKNLTDQDEETLTLYAQWRSNTHTITYDLNGGTLNGKTGKITLNCNDGDVITVMDAPTREGYTFDYWEGSKYYPGDKYTVLEDHTLKAVWKENEKKKDDPKKDDPKKKKKSSSGSSSKNSGTSVKPNSVKTVQSMKTGDNSRHIFWLIVLIAGAATLIGIGVYRVTGKKDE